MSDIKVVNKSATRVLFSDFNAGDNAIPFDTKWIEPRSEGMLKVGNFKSLSIGAQVQEGGRWLGGDPKDPPYAVPGQTLVFDITKSPT
jgi:hypothetical protein